MSKGQTKKTREAAGNRRKLTRAEKKQIAEAIRKAKGDGKTRTAQQTIPYLAMYPDGICKVTEKKYSKCVVFEDINYQLAQADDKTAYFLELHALQINLYVFGLFEVDIGQTDVDFSGFIFRGRNT